MDVRDLTLLVWLPEGHPVCNNECGGGREETSWAGA